MASVTVTRDRSANGAQVLRIRSHRNRNRTLPDAAHRSDVGARPPGARIHRAARSAGVRAERRGRRAGAGTFGGREREQRTDRAARARAARRRRRSSQYAPAGGGDSYEVQRGDSLSAIARRLSASTGARTDQLMVSIFRGNSGAFEGDMNRLRAGSVLRIPSSERNRRGIARPKRSDEVQPRRRLLGRVLRGLRARRPPAPGAAQRFCGQRRLRHRQFGRSRRSCRIACASSKASSTNPSACSSCATPNLPTCRPSWPPRSKPPRRSPRRRPRSNNRRRRRKPSRRRRPKPRRPKRPLRRKPCANA